MIILFALFESELAHFRARYFDSELGRFISRDPKNYIDGMNLYRGYFVPGGVDWSGLEIQQVSLTWTVLGNVGGTQDGSGVTTMEYVFDVDVVQNCGEDGETPYQTINWVGNGNLVNNPDNLGFAVGVGVGISTSARIKTIGNPTTEDCPEGQTGKIKTQTITYQAYNTVGFTVGFLFLTGPSVGFEVEMATKSVTYTKSCCKCALSPGFGVSDTPYLE